MHRRVCAILKPDLGLLMRLRTAVFAVLLVCMVWSALLGFQRGNRRRTEGEKAMVRMPEARETSRPQYPSNHTSGSLGSGYREEAVREKDGIKGGGQAVYDHKEIV